MTSIVIVLVVLAATMIIQTSPTLGEFIDVYVNCLLFGRLFHDVMLGQSSHFKLFMGIGKLRTTAEIPPFN